MWKLFINKLCVRNIHNLRISTYCPDSHNFWGCDFIPWHSRHNLTNNKYYYFRNITFGKTDEFFNLSVIRLDSGNYCIFNHFHFGSHNVCFNQNSTVLSKKIIPCCWEKQASLFRAFSSADGVCILIFAFPLSWYFLQYPFLFILLFVVSVY